MNYSAFDDCAVHYQGVGYDIEDAAQSLNLGPEKFALRDRIDSQRCVKDVPRQNRMSLWRLDRLHILSEQAGRNERLRGKLWSFGLRGVVSFLTLKDRQFMSERGDLRLDDAW